MMSVGRRELSVAGAVSRHELSTTANYKSPVPTGTRLISRYHPNQKACAFHLIVITEMLEHFRLRLPFVRSNPSNFTLRLRSELPKFVSVRFAPTTDSLH